MPRRSHRQSELRRVKQKLELAILLETSSDDSLDSSDSANSAIISNTSGSSEESDLDDLDEFCHFCPITELSELYFLLYNTRYLLGRPVVPKSDEFSTQFFHTLPDKLFRQLTRMDKPTFFHLLSLIQDDPIFHSNGNHSQTPIVRQLAVCLDRIGHHGNGACLGHLVPTWGVSTGTLVNFSKRCFHAIERALENEVKWPTEAERLTISESFALKGFPGCVGLIDGTLLPIAQRPHHHGEVYFDRKCRYSMNAQVVCDHQRKILAIYTGLPGTVHDMTCLKRTVLWNHLSAPGNNIMFLRGEYLLGDSAYTSWPHMVGAFKRADISPAREDFNICVAKCRVVNEHCIGVLKSRWYSLRELRTQLNEKKDNTWMVRWILMAARLHNFVIGQNDPWTEEDAADEAALPADELPVQDPPPDEGPQASRRDTAASASHLLTTVMDHAIAHHRTVGTFAALGRE